MNDGPDTLTVEAPAKLNLSLRVLGRRDDGFHELDSLMVKLPGLHDSLSFRAAEGDRFTCNEEGLPTDDGNLVLKALRLFREHTGRSEPLAIHLEKRIPHGAGLGGGSSDAATTLLALDGMHATGLGADRLVKLAAAIGSDVPFFLGPDASRVRGRGEILEKAEPLPRTRVLLLKPGFGVSTPEAYGRWRDSTELPGVSYQPQPFAGRELVNDLERPVFQKHLFLAEMKNWLLGRAEVVGALMSGSGSTMFAVVRPGADGDRLAALAREQLDPTLWAWSGHLGG